MRHTKKMLVLLTLIGIAAIGALQWRKHQTDIAQSPPPMETGATQRQVAPPKAQFAPRSTAASTDTSEWARRYAIRSNVNDVESVTRTFKEANDCLLYHVARDELNAILNDERLDDLSNETLATLENVDATSSRYLSIARQTEALCIGSDRDALTQVYTDANLKAALQGNPDAESCFVTSVTPLLGSTPVASSKSFEDRYLNYAPIFMQNALERGDPYVAARALYLYVASSGGHPSRLDDLQKADPYLTWQAARLASLRALPEQRARLETRLTLFEEQNLLQPGDIKRADAWARATYEREFAGQPSINLDSNPACYSSSDLAP